MLAVREKSELHILIFFNSELIVPYFYFTPTLK